MHYIPYNSRIDYHKSKFGAVKENENVTFRVIMPRNFSVSAVYLVIREDDNERYEYISLSWERMEGDKEEWWKTDYKPSQKGVYWYHFEYDTPFGRSVISRVNGGIGSLSGNGSDWQLTVYSSDFSTPDDYKGGIIYQIFPDRFHSSGKEKKDVPSDRILRQDWYAQPYWKPDEKGITKNNDFFGGDLKGIEEKLDYIKSLGVNCIYINPIFKAQSNHRYDTGDYEQIDSMLGDEDDFKSLCKKAKENGIRIILDGVFSHTGVDSKYFNFYSSYDSVGAYQSQDSEYYDWYKFKNWPDDYECWWGIKILPEVKEENEKFLEYIAGENGIAEKWLKAGADGWRLDVADELPDVFLDRLRERVKSINKDAIILGEVWEDASNKFSYGKRRRYLLGNQLDSVMNYPFSQAIIDFVKTGNTDGFSEKIMSVLENYPKCVIDVLMNHIGSHDTVRIINALAGEDARGRGRDWQSQRRLSHDEIEKGKKLLKIAATIQYTLPGIPSVYYGDETALEGYADPFNRCCYPWGREDEDMINFYRELGKIRRNNDCFVDGDFEVISDVCSCIAFVRRGKSSDIMTIANRNDTEIDYYLHDPWKSAEVLIGGEMYDSYVKIPANTAVLLRLTK